MVQFRVCDRMQLQRLLYSSLFLIFSSADAALHLHWKMERHTQIVRNHTHFDCVAFIFCGYSSNDGASREHRTLYRRDERIKNGENAMWKTPIWISPYGWLCVSALWLRLFCFHFIFAGALREWRTNQHIDVIVDYVFKLLRSARAREKVGDRGREDQATALRISIHRFYIFSRFLYVYFFAFLCCGKRDDSKRINSKKRDKKSSRFMN